MIAILQTMPFLLAYIRSHGLPAFNAGRDTILTFDEYIVDGSTISLPVFLPADWTHVRMWLGY